MPTPGRYVASKYIRVLGAREVQAKLLLARPHILAHNREMISTMLDFVKAEVVAATPVGPGHFGFHLRDSYTTDVKSYNVKSVGVFKATAQGYWLEFGTLSQFKRGGQGAFTAETNLIFAQAGTFGERPRMLAHKALRGVRKFIKFYYGGMANWWRL